MITRDDIRELANFHSPEGCAVTFYYQPTTPPTGRTVTKPSS